MIFVREFNKNWTFRNSWWANRKKTKKRRNCKLKFSVKWNSRQDGVHLSEGLLTCCWNISSISMLLLWAARKEEKDDQTYEFEQHVAGVTHLSPRQRFPGFLRRLSRTFDDLFEVSLKRNLGSLIIRSSLILSKGIERSSLAAQYLLLNAVFNNRARENYRFMKKKKKKKICFICFVSRTSRWIIRMNLLPRRSRDLEDTPRIFRILEAPSPRSLSSWQDTRDCSVPRICFSPDSTGSGFADTPAPTVRTVVHFVSRFRKMSGTWN